MATLTEHIIKLTDHRDRELLELTLSKALIDLLRIDRVVVAKVVSEEGVRRWLDVATLDARGGGKVVDPLRVDFDQLEKYEEQRHRVMCLFQRDLVEHAWAGEEGPRISYLPLFSEANSDDVGVIEVHSGGSLNLAERQVIEDLVHVYRNMYKLLAYSDRDALTGLLNRKALDDTFYSAVLEEMDHGLESLTPVLEPSVLPVAERRHRVPPNYWLGTIRVDGYGQISDKSGQLIAEEVLLLIARIMNNTFRTYDRLYRLGRDQFAVLMHCPQEELVLAAFERFRANVEKFNFPQVGRVTTCSGFARVSADDSPETSLQHADSAVDYGRNEGGNKVHSHPDLVRRGQTTGAAPLGIV